MESSSGGTSPIDLGELALLGGGAFLIALSAFVFARLLRSLRHGFSVRLQLFAALSLISLLITSLIGWWGVVRIEARASLLLEERGVSTELIASLFEEFGPKIGLLLFTLALCCALSAYALGGGIARPLERLVAAAEGIARRRGRGPLPPPAGREVRRLTEAFIAMQETLEGRRRFEHFIADLSHDLKNPVAGIRAATEVLQSGAGEDPALRARFLRRIDEAGVRLEHLLSDFLALARLEAQGARDDPQPVELASLARQALKGVSPQAALKSLKLESQLEPLLLWGSASWLRRALDNLLSNAIRYSPEGGRISLSLSLSDAGAVRCLICDEGPGIEPALAEQIFDRFVTHGSHHRGDHRGGELRRRGSTGLGLAIVKEICAHHQGSVTCLPAGPLSGACFELTLLGSRARPWRGEPSLVEKRLHGALSER